MHLKNLILPIQRRNWLFWYTIRPWKFLLYEKKRILQNESKSCHTWKKIFSSQKMQLTDEIFFVYIQFLNKVKIFIVHSIWIKFSTYLFIIYYFKLEPFEKISWFAHIFYINPPPRPPLPQLLKPRSALDTELKVQYTAYCSLFWSLRDVVGGASYTSN